MLSDIKFEKEKNFEYGANLHQTAQLYNAQNPINYELLSDVELQYNDILDLKTGLDIASEFYDVKAAVIIKSGMPCGVALGSDCLEAYQKAFDCDPISALNSALIFTDKVDENIAVLVKKMVFNVICAPDYTSKALDMLLNIENLKIVKINTTLEDYRKLVNYEINVTPFGVLVQSQDKKELDSKNFKVVSKAKPTTEQIEDAVFAWKIVKHAKSEAVVIASNFKTLAISQGNTCRVNAVEHALDYACNDSKDAVLATDGEIPAVDSINAAVQGRIGLIIQTGSSQKSVIDAVNKYNLVMINTGISHIKY
jgi:phosphoribosylaminoimidazolecarboxamide formyltransferase/IMP cyclohydrolase